MTRLVDDEPIESAFAGDDTNATNVVLGRVDLGVELLSQVDQGTYWEAKPERG